MIASRGFVLDAGAFIAIERQDRRMLKIVENIRVNDTPVITSAGVVAQVWRGGKGKQIPIAFLLRRTEVHPIDQPTARMIGVLLGDTGTSDPVDAHIAFLAHDRDWWVITSDPGDLKAIDPNLRVLVV